MCIFVSREKTLTQELSSHGVSTIGDLAKLTEDKIDRLSFKAPKKTNVYATLEVIYVYLNSPPWFSLYLSSSLITFQYLSCRTLKADIVVSRIVHCVVSVSRFILFLQIELKYITRFKLQNLLLKVNPFIISLSNV